MQRKCVGLEIFFCLILIIFTISLRYGVFYFSLTSKYPERFSYQVTYSSHTTPLVRESQLTVATI